MLQGFALPTYAVSFVYRKNCLPLSNAGRGTISPNGSYHYTHVISFHIHHGQDASLFSISVTENRRVI